MPGRAGGAATYPVTLSEDPHLTPAKSVDDFVIGVIDTGILSFGGQPHPYLAGHLTDDWAQQVDEFTAPDIPNSADGHGTFVAGVILRQAPTAKIQMRNTLDGFGQNSDPRIAQAIRDMAADSHVKLVNLSFFGDETEKPPTEIEAALKELFDFRPDLVVVTAAGNSGTVKPLWPAAFRFPRLMSIGAVDETVVPSSRLLAPPESLDPDHPIPPIASFSNHGPTVDAYAGGVSVLGPHFINDSGMYRPSWCHWGGTSFAAAAVTGQIAQAMITMQIDARQALERVLTLEKPVSVTSDPAPLVPMPGVRPEFWRPYIRTGNPDWTPA